MIQTRIKQRFDTESNWLTSNVILLDGELAVVDCGQQIRFKVGNGLSSFSQLKYIDQDQLSTIWITAHAISQGSQAHSTPFGLAAGYHLSANADFSQALGVRSQTSAGDSFSFVWNGDSTQYPPIQFGTDNYYNSHGKGTFNINPKDGLSGFYIGEQSLASVLTNSANKVFIKDPSVQEYADGKQSDLSVIKLTNEEYAQMLSTDSAEPNVLYVISSEYNDAYGQQIKNIASPTDLSDAATKEYVDNAMSSIQIPTDLSAFTNSPGYLSAHQSLSNYYQKSETSSADEISNALSAKADLSSIEHIVLYEQDGDGNYTGVTIGSRDPNASVGPNSFVNGRNGLATGYYSHAEGYETYAAAYAHAEGGHTSALGNTSHTEGYGTIADNQGTHAEGGYTSAFGYYSHTEGGWSSTGANAIGAHAEGGFTRADGPISHVEGIKATAEISDYQSFVWQGTDVMPNELTDITPSTWDEYKAHGPGTFNVNPAKGLNGVYIGETSLYDLVKDDHLTIIEFDNGEAQAFDWSGDITDETMVDAGLYDDNEGSWILNPVYVRIGNNVTSIGNNAFVNCTSLTSVTIPDSVTSIGYCAFYNCSGLISVTIGNSVTSIEYRAFNGCSSLTSLAIPDSVMSIGENAFYSCSGLTNVTIGKNVAIINSGAFWNCTSLSNDSNLSSITIDKGNWEKLFNDVDFEYYRSNRISDDESTSMSASIEASESFPVTIKLKTSSEEGCDILTLSFDGQELTSMSGETGWQYLPVTIPSGSHTVVLTYSKDGSSLRGDDHAYFAIVQGCIAVKGKTQEEAEQLLANANAPETCKIITIDDSSASGGNQIDVTYAELVQMRSNGNLAPGMKYRITDYVTAVDQENCRSAGHPFDLIVTAVDNHTLDEHAIATLPSNGDTYFDARPFHVPDYQQYLEYGRVPLESWDIKYCLDNDKTRFKFADTENGKGVIYYMKDEFGNEAPYDFKNVQFKRYEITAITNWNRSDWGQHDLIGTYGLPTNTVEVDDQSYIWCYTFNGSDYVDYGFSEPYDFSGWHIAPTQALQSQFNSAIERLQECSENLIGVWQESSDDYTLMAFKLPNIVFQCALNVVPVEQLPFLKIGMCSQNRFGKNCYDNTFGDSCNSNTFGDNCYSNTFGTDCNSNTFVDSCYGNMFGNSCSNNTFGIGCNGNMFGTNCYGNMFGNSCSNNTFGNSCYSNTFGTDCNSNTFVDSCYGNMFGNSCSNNTFGNSCYSNTFGNYCYSNTFGDNCDSNTFGDNCYSNTFGDNCDSNTFGDNCDSNTFGNSCSNNTFGNSCYSNTFGTDCNSNTFSNNCYSNTFGNYCYSNTFGTDCNSNTFVDSCYGNMFGNSCSNNTFGIGCNGNMFGTNCYGNMFGNSCYSNTFGTDCTNIKFGSSSNVTSQTAKSYCRYINIASGNCNIVLNATATTSSSSYYQNIDIKPGINRNFTYKTITDNNVNQNFCTTYQPANSQVIAI